MNIMKRTGPSMVPWGTPEVTGTYDEVALFTTTLWILLLTNDAIQAWALETDIISLDFAKALDTIPHCRLLYKLDWYGIRGAFFGQGYMSDHIIVISVEFHKIFTYKKHMVVTAETISWSLITGKISMFITVDGSLVKKRSRILVPLIGEVTSWCNPWSCTMSIRWLWGDTWLASMVSDQLMPGTLKSPANQILAFLNLSLSKCRHV